MSAKTDRMISLAMTNSRLKMASDFLRWSMNKESKSFAPQDDVLAMIKRIDEWGEAAFQLLYESDAKK